MIKNTNKIKKVSYGLSSKPLEALNDVVINEGTLEYIDPTFVDMEGVGDPEEIGGVMKTEPVSSPNKNRELEILKIMTSYNIGPENFIKKANLDVIALSAVAGGRVAFNMLSRVKDFEFGNDIFSNVPSANIDDFITELETEYKKTFDQTSSGYPNLTNDAQRQKILIDTHKYPALGGIEASNFSNPHLLLYCFKKVEDKMTGGNKGLFECNPSNYIMGKILTMSTELDSDIREFEQFLLDNEAVLLTAAAGSSAVSAGAQQALFATLNRNILAKLLRIIPGVEGPKDILKLLIGAKALNEAYYYVLKNDMCNNIDKYKIKGGVIQADVDNALYLLQKSIMGNLRNVFRSIGSFAKDLKTAVTLGAQDFKRQLAPAAGDLSYQQVDDLDDDLKEEISIPFLSDNTTKFYTFDDSVIDDASSMKSLFEGSVPEMFNYGQIVVTPVKGPMTDIELGSLIAQVIRQAGREQISYTTSEFYGTSVGEIERDGLYRSKSYCGNQNSVSVPVKGVFQAEARETTQFTGDGYSYDYTALGNVGVLDQKGSPSPIGAGEIFFASKDDQFLFMASVIGFDRSKQTAVFREISSLEDADINDPGSLKMVLDSKTFKHDVAVLVKQIEISGIDSAQIPGVTANYFLDSFPDTGKTCVDKIDMATAYSALRFYVMDKNLISETRLKKKVEKSIKKEEDAASKDQRKSRRLQRMRGFFSGN